ncbi:hypothetical protein MPLSOD_110179 [Mesorhizobium sp. SOD10]|nr:hypothetical protein MPLSOD_110179 [Mesorhizobium sp. SOD10]
MRSMKPKAVAATGSLPRLPEARRDPFRVCSYALDFNLAHVFVPKPVATSGEMLGKRRRFPAL